MMLRRGVPHLLLALTLTASAAGGWVGHELGPDGRAARADARWRTQVAPLLGRAAVAVASVNDMTHATSDQLTQADVLTHGDAEPELQAVRRALLGLREPSAQRARARALIAAVDHVTTSLGALAEAARRLHDEATYDTYTVARNDFEAAGGELTDAGVALFGVRSFTDLAPAQGKGVGDYLLRVDTICSAAATTAFSHPLKTRALYVRDGDLVGAAFVRAAQRLASIDITGPSSGRSFELHRELLATIPIGTAIRQIAHAIAIRDPASAAQALNRVRIGVPHARKAGQIFRSLGATWCSDIYSVPLGTSGTTTT